jgi:hypothetical protein
MIRGNGKEPLADTLSPRRWYELPRRAAGLNHLLACRVAELVGRDRSGRPIQP